jgi:hypothetical protein
MIVTLNPAFDSMRGSLDRIVFYTCNGQVRARSYAVPRDPKTASAGRKRNIVLRARHLNILFIAARPAKRFCRCGAGMERAFMRRQV